MENKAYGAVSTPIQIEQILNFTCLEGKVTNRKAPICIWGTHGIGKTQLIQDFAKKNGMGFKYIAPAQFEEMGDLHGIPEVIEENGRQVTKFIIPEWVPVDEGPGILLLDDINRADDRILRGCMQLIQNYELVSWKLPKGWQIVATANPDDMDYSVTSMDNAMLTRLIHTTMIFDAKSWAKWAMASEIDSRGISFVLTYPELVNTNLTTPRTLTMLFELIKPIANLKAHEETVLRLAAGCIDEYAAAAFMNFINDDLNQLIEPEEVLNEKDFKTAEKRIKSLAKGSKGEMRLDRLSTVCTRISLFLTTRKYDPKELLAENLVSFLLLEILPKDLTMSLYKDLVNSNDDYLKSLLRRKELAQFLLDQL